MDEHAPYRIARVVRWGAALATAFLMGIVGTTEAVSANFPHFKSFSVTISSGTATTTAKAAAAAATADLPDLLFTWTEVGIGAPDVTYELRSVVTATFGCVNSGSNQPHAGNKTTVTAPVSTVSTLTSDQNGKISGSVVLDTGTVGTGGLVCPQGQSLVALSVTFAQNTITDTTNGVTATDDDIVVILGP